MNPENWRICPLGISRDTVPFMDFPAPCPFSGLYVGLRRSQYLCRKTCRPLANVWTTEYIFLIEMKQGWCIFPLSWSVHCNFIGDGKCNERGLGVHPPPSPARLILPSWWNVRQKADVTTLCTLWCGPHVSCWFTACFLPCLYNCGAVWRTVGTGSGCPGKEPGPRKSDSVWRAQGAQAPERRKDRQRRNPARLLYEWNCYFFNWTMWFTRSYIQQAGRYGTSFTYSIDRWNMSNPQPRVDHPHWFNADPNPAFWLTRIQFSCVNLTVTFNTIFYLIFFSHSHRFLFWGSSS